MKKATARLILYQLIEARRALQAIWTGEGDPKEIAASVAFKSIAISKGEVDEFFTTEEGQRIAHQFGV